MRSKNDHLAYEILSAVSEIPFGKVATYGQIARLIGRDKNARLGGAASCSLHQTACVPLGTHPTYES